MDKLIVNGKITDLDRSKNDVTYLPIGQSLIAEEHWDKCAAKCKGESSMLTALKIEDMRTKK